LNEGDSRVFEVYLRSSYNNKTYRVDDIDWNQTPNSKFMKSDKTEISFADYYKQVENPLCRLKLRLLWRYTNMLIIIIIIIFTNV